MRLSICFNYEISDQNGSTLYFYSFRLRDNKGTIRVKLDASEEGSGLVMLDKDTNPVYHVLAKQNGAKFTLTDNEGKKREY